MVEHIKGIPIMRPFIDQDNQVYWDAVKQHKLVVQHCRACDSYLHPPRPMCPSCNAQDTLEWKPSSGKGHIYSFVNFTTDRMAYPAFKLPYAVVLVELEEGVRITGNTDEIHPDEIYVGMPVEIMFEDLEDDLTLYRFKKRDG